jgi:hypothetical protein
MTARLRDIPPSLWQRLARLDGRFDFSMERRGTNLEKGTMTTCRNYARCWVVRVIDPRDPRQTMTSESPYLAAALQAAVGAAEARVAREAAAGRAARPFCRSRAP